MRTINLFLICSLLLLTVQSCKKTIKDNTSTFNCNDIISKKSGNDVYTYEYNNEDKPVKVFLNGSLNTTIEYKNNGKLIVETTGNTTTQYYLNDNSLPDSIIYRTSKVNNIWELCYTYDQNNAVVRLISIDRDTFDVIADKADESYTNTIVNGNIVSSVNNSSLNPDSYSYTYDTAKAGNYTYKTVEKPVPGLSKNLVTSAVHYYYSMGIAPRTDYINYKYSFDNHGRIIKLIRTSNSVVSPVDTLIYTYRCN